MTESYDPDYHIKIYAKENNKMLILFFDTSNYNNCLRCYYLYDYDNYDDFLYFYLKISKKEQSYYPYCNGGELEFEDIQNDEIIINDNCLTKIVIFNYPEIFEEHLDEFSKIYN
jgi:hypothetical protein